MTAQTTARGPIAAMLLTLAAPLLLAASCGDGQESPRQVVQEFFHAAITAAPPQSNEVAIEAAFERLTWENRSLLETSGMPPSAALGLFVGWQNVPESFEVVDSSEDGATATTTVLLRYSGGDTVRDVHLAFEDEGWKIESISPV